MKSEIYRVHDALRILADVVPIQKNGPFLREITQLQTAVGQKSARKHAGEKRSDFLSTMFLLLSDAKFYETFLPIPAFGLEMKAFEEKR